MQQEGEFRLFTADDKTRVSYGPYYDDCRYLALSLFIADFNNLFYDVLGCPRPEIYTEGKDVHQHWERQRAKFQGAIADMPQLGRLWHAWEQTHYKSEEVSSLSGECREVEKRISNPGR